MSSPSAKLKVFIAGASGETGRSITKHLLLQPDRFDVVALARAESASKKIYTDFSQQGVTVIPTDLRNVDALENILTSDKDTPASNIVVISCLTMIELAGELALVEAARRTKVGRFVPSFWAIVCPPRGILSMRAAKEDVLDAIKRAHLPYTAIDIGWWYQWCLPRLPSGKLDAVLTYPDTEIVGTGEVRSALTDIDDIGKYVARIITDPRTLNKLVFAYGEVKTQREVWDMVEALAGGEKIPRPVLSAEDVERIISSANEALAKDQSNMAALVEKGWTEYKLSRGIRADNTPEYAKYLGYLDVKELYPEIEARTIKDYISEVLVGKSNAVLYAGQEDHALKLLKAPK